MSSADLEARAHELRERARSIAAPMVAEARGVTTLANERAVLRLMGVTGVDRAGRPLAYEVVQRFAALGPGRLGGGIALPFAAAGHEYDLDPQELAVEIADGHVDMALEAELLAEPERRVDAERSARRWLDAGIERFEANRTARRELMDALGSAPPPQVAVDLGQQRARDAIAVLPDLMRDGIDLVRVGVPSDRELRHSRGHELHEARPDDEPGDAPAGSQRGLALLRAAVDEASVERGRYTGLGVTASGLSVPESAVVAGFERLDVRWDDPVRAIVELGVEPRRAVADHTLAVGIDARSGVFLGLGPGPAALASEVAEASPVDPYTRAGRALALQALSVELSLAAGLPPERVVVAALALDGFAGDGDLPRGLPEVVLRRLCFPDHDLCVDGVAAPSGWTGALTGWLSGGPPARIVVVRDSPARADEVRAAVRAAEWLGHGREIGPLRGSPLGYARMVLDAALTTLRGLAADGWDSLLGTAREERALGAAGVVERRGYFDPLPAVDPVAGAVS